jgi:hypothetical protein
MGRTFGHLEILDLKHVYVRGEAEYTAICRCVCGTVKEIRLTSVRYGKTKSCGCRMRDFYQELKGSGSPHFRGCGDIGIAFWNRCLKGAKGRNIPFDLTIESAWDLFLTQDRKCALSGAPLVFGGLRSESKIAARKFSVVGATTASLDRIDSTRGYVEGNVQWVHKVVNLMKNSLPMEEFLHWCHAVANRACES